MSDKKVRCIGCGKPIAEEANIQVGMIKITCKCGTVNTIQAEQKKGEPEKIEIPVIFKPSGRTSRIGGEEVEIK